MARAGKADKWSVICQPVAISTPWSTDKTYINGSLQSKTHGSFSSWQMIVCTDSDVHHVVSCTPEWHISSLYYQSHCWGVWALWRIGRSHHWNLAGLCAPQAYTAVLIVWTHCPSHSHCLSLDTSMAFTLSRPQAQTPTVANWLVLCGSVWAAFVSLYIAKASGIPDIFFQHTHWTDS